MVDMSATGSSFEKTKKRPLHEQVREHLRAQCLAARPDVTLPTLRQLSESLGVNHITISRALRDLEAEGLVRVVPGRGTFVTKVESANRSIEMVTLCTQVGGLLETSLHTFKGMQERVQSGYSLYLTTLSMPPVPKSEVFLQKARERNTDALAIFDFEYLPYPDSFLETQLIHELAEQMPVVLVGKEHNSLKLDCIYCDPAPQMQTFLEECYENGARRFGYIGINAVHHHLRHRLTAFQQFLLSHSLFWQKPADSLDTTTEIQQLLDSKPEVVVVSDPWIAHRLVIEAQQRGLQLGDELQILCFAGSLQQVQAIVPYVSIILLEEEEVGRCVANRLHNRLVGTDKPPPLTRRIPGKLLRQGKTSV